MTTRLSERRRRGRQQDRGIFDQGLAAPAGDQSALVLVFELRGESVVIVLDAARTRSRPCACAGYGYVGDQARPTVNNNQVFRRRGSGWANFTKVQYNWWKLDGGMVQYL